ncbi:S-layer homology domain-containing protein [Paenibacillus sp. KQZ6P-2]|uniref:S-layer homology domain-containing protein n=1 Tax=Paenibacillus mangrovi TaxID=2931978 RepID=A0A9X2B1Q4_9BACL|nr:S-layer homology domain-containing protein [Paenibacillus mangrovi]MCJ8011506.1 S-layer homology domain-containing protein [Paenibacillus mangrovi]
MKRFLSVTLALTMIFGVLSTSTYAETDTAGKNDKIASITFNDNLKDDVNNEDLIAHGDYSFVDGVLPGTKALHLESGDGNYVSTPNSLNFGEENFTVSFWYKGDTNNKQVILSNKDFSNGSNAGWAIYTSANSINMNFGFPTAKEKNISFGRNTFDASDWRHVTYVVDREKMLASLYIDGYEMAETTLKLGSLDTSNPLNIGSDGLGNLGGNSFDIADLMIWKGAFSSDAVQANYNSYDVNKVDLTALNNTIAEANAIIAGGLGNGFSESDFDYLKKVLNTATTVATTQKEKLYTQETINYYERELDNAIFIYQKSNKTLTPADLNMIVDSDTEISDNPAAIARVEDDFRKSLKTFPQADVMLIPGDVTGGNNAVEYLWMQELTKVYDKIKAEGLFDNIALYLVRGNHDMGGAEQFVPVGSAGAWNETTQSYDNNFFNDAYRVKIKGYNLVVFDGNYDNNNTSGKAKDFLDQITKEPDYDPTKPIFVSSHFPISGTNWGSEWSTSASNNVGKYIADNNLSQVVYLSGHTHYDPTDERSLYQGAASYFDAGSTNYSSYIDGGPYGGYIEGAYINYHTTPRIANFLEVYDTKVIIKHYNLSTDEFVGIPSVVHVGEGQDAFTYSKSDIRELIAPQFDEGLKIKSLKSNEVTFTMKQANDNVRALEYNVQLINKLTGEVDNSFNSLSLPLDKPFDEYREYTMTGLLPDTPYILRVFAADSMYNRSSQDIELNVNRVNLTSVIAPSDVIDVALGAAKTANALGLPSTVSLVTDSFMVDANVTWNVDASNYDPNVRTPQTFTVNGTITLPAIVANPNAVPLTTSIRVTVNKASVPTDTATVTASSFYNSNYSPNKVIDGIKMGAPGVGEWASLGEKNPWIQVNWPTNQTINQITFYDRANPTDWSQGGTLTFSDGSTLEVSGIPNDGSGYSVNFPARTVTWVKFQISSNSGGSNGLSEMEFAWIIPAEVPTTPQSTLTGLQQVDLGQTFDVTMGLNDETQRVFQSVYAQDLTLHYDPTILQLDSITSLKDGFQVIGQKEIAPGQIRIMAASLGTDVPAQGDLLAFKFTAKAATQASAKTTVSIDNVVIANEKGKELQVAGASHEVTVSEDGGQVGTIPAVPTGLKAKAEGASQINVTWKNSADATGYDLMVDGAIHMDVANPFEHTGLAANTSHTYKVRAKNAAGASEWSTQVTESTKSEKPNPDPKPEPKPEPKPKPDPKPEPKPEPKPDPKPEPKPKDVFNGKIVNEEKLIEAIESKVEEAKKSNAKMEPADIKGHWAEKTIATFAKLQVITGFEDGTFRPNSPITRAEFATIIARVFDIHADSANDGVELSDIQSHWAKDAINNLASAGVINGYGDGSFKPNKTISREEMVIILSRIVDLSKVDKDESKGNFTDMSSASSYAVNKIQDAAKAGIINGKGNGVFDPQGSSTRAEALTIILNALNLDPQIETLFNSLN